MFSQETYKAIEAYLEGRLNEMNIRKFEQQIARNQALAVEIVLWRQIDKALEDLEACQFQKMIHAQKKAFFEAINESRAITSKFHPTGEFSQ